MLVSNLNFHKTFVPIKLTATLSPGFTQTGSTMIQQDKLIENKGNTASVLLKLEIKSIDKIYLVYQSTGRVSWQDNNLGSKYLQKDSTTGFDFLFSDEKA